MELVSIIMPVKNAALYLHECLDSILQQTYHQWELIAVDDNSSDASKNIMENAAKQDARIHQVNNAGRGIISALQTGYSHAKGSFITRMDADDMMASHRLEKMLKLLSQQKSKCVVTGLVKYVSDLPISYGYLKYENWINNINLTGKQWRQIYRECVIASPNWMISKSALDEIGGFNDLTYPEDYHLVIKWYQKQLEILTIPEVTLYWREHPSRTSRNSENYDQQAFFNLKINQFIKTDLRAENLVLWGNNEKTKLTSNILNNSGIIFHQFDLHDFKKTEKLKNPQILVGVYPELDQRKKLETYLSGLSLSEGTDWWYI